MKHAFYTGTRNIYGDMETAAKSLVANSDVDAVHFLIEDAAFPRELPDIVECHDASGQEYFPPGGPNMKTQYSYMALMRAALWDMFPDAGRALVLDCDTIAVRDVSAAWDLELGGAYIAATPEWHRSRNGLVYCNCGVVLQDFQALRGGKGADYLCQGWIAPMPCEYNANHWTVRDFFDAPEDVRESLARIVHYAGMKEFRDMPEYVKYRDMTWEEAMGAHDAGGAERWLQVSFGLFGSIWVNEFSRAKKANKRGDWRDPVPR